MTTATKQTPKEREDLPDTPYTRRARYFDANWLIVQDGGLYYHCRTMGFRFRGAL